MPSLPQLRHQREDEPVVPVTAAPSVPEAANQDILALLRIAPQTQIPESVITSAESSNVQFRTSQPEGYLFHDVEEWHRAVASSLAWYEEALHKRDTEIVRLATEVDRAQVDKINQKYEAEWLSAKVEAGAPATSSPGVAPEEVAALTERVLVLQGEVDRYRSMAEAQVLGGGSHASDNPLTDAERIAYNELVEWASQVEVAYSQMETELAVARAALESNDPPPPPPAPVASPEGLSDEERQAYQALQEWAANAEATFSQVNAELEVTREELANARQYSAELDAYLNEITPLLSAATGSPVEVEPARAPEVVTPQMQPSYPQQQPAQSASKPGGFSLSSATYDDDDEEAAPASSPAPVSDQPEDAYNNLLREMQSDMNSDSDAPELGAGVRFESEVDRTRGHVTPGAPLRSIPEGADPNDYL